MNISVVIGASYGDEGKGLVTDFLSSPEALVVRFNGGAQAGHTVVTPEGHRHVFHHYGSGTFRGAATFLSRHFIFNPILLLKEAEELKSKFGIEPQLLVDPRALVTTPYDMMMNQAVERERGQTRHGSCGVGINETVTRSEAGFPLTVEDIFDLSTPQLERKLLEIRNIWVPNRLRALGVKKPLEAPHFKSNGIFEKFIEDLRLLAPVVTRVLEWTRGVPEVFEHIVFEGAQGLRLDQNSPDFPHVTRSNTGLVNVVEMLNDGNMFFPTEAVKVHYLTRTYLTRHGAGPLSHELPEKPFGKIDDRTNITNAHQGSLRFARLDLDQLSASIQADRRLLPLAFPNFVVTCADQLDGNRLLAVKDGQPKDMTLDEFLGHFDHLRTWISFGPTRSEIHSCSKTERHRVLSVWGPRERLSPETP